MTRSRAPRFRNGRRCVEAGVDALSSMREKPGSRACLPRKTATCRRSTIRWCTNSSAPCRESPIAINGGLDTIAAYGAQLDHLDGVMVGRAAYHDLSHLIEIDEKLFGAAPPHASSRAAVEAFLPYVERKLEPRREACRHHPPHARPVRRTSGRARLPPASRDGSGPARRGRRGRTRGFTRTRRRGRAGCRACRRRNQR